VMGHNFISTFKKLFFSLPVFKGRRKRGFWTCV